MNPRRFGLWQALARSWFPLALAGLLLVSLPGLVLFTLTVFGGQSAVNGWLEEHLKLSYHLPVHWGLGLVLLLVPLLIALLYFLKLKRKPLSVPSTFLWKKSIEDLHVNALFQWLRQNVLLLLQLLTVLLLIYAFLDFRLHGRTSAGKHYILMIDNSASMSATDLGPTRLDWAKQEALKEIDAAGDDDYGMVIVFNSSAEIRQSYTNNRAVLRQVVRDIGPTQRPTRIEEALSLAESLANPRRTADDASVRPDNVEPGKERTYVAAEGIVTDVHLFSDGRFEDMPDFAVGKLNINYHIAGVADSQKTNNVALVRFNAERDESDPTQLVVFSSLANYRASRVTARLQLDVSVNGQLRGVHEREVALPARRVSRTKVQNKEDEFLVTDEPGEMSVTFSLADIDDQAHVILHARLKTFDEAGREFQDDLRLDDEAWLVVGVVRRARVLLVGPRNDILAAFFDDESTREVASVTRWGPEVLDPNNAGYPGYRQAARNGEYDLIVFDRCAPLREEDLPRSNTFFIGRPPPPWNLETLEKVSNPSIKGWMGRHPAMRYLVALQEIGIAEAFRLKDLPSRTPRLIEADQNTGLLVALGRDLYTDLVLTFAILNDQGEWNTNWPLHPSFPLFLRNVLYAYGNVSDGTGEELTQPGQVKTLRPDVAVAEIEVTDPAGKRYLLKRGNRPDFNFGDTNLVGVYQVAWHGAWQRSFSVNLLDPGESNLDPRTDFHLGDTRIERGRNRSQPRELWKWLVLAALGLLLTEWYIYNKRVHV